VEYKEMIKTLLPLLTFVVDYDKGKFAGRLLKRFDYDFLVDRLPAFDPDRASEKTYRGYFKALEVWYRLNYGEWKASRNKQEDTDMLNKLGDIFKDHFTGIGEKVDDGWRARAMERRKHLMKRRTILKDGYAKASYRRKLEIYPTLIELTQQIRNIENRLEGIK
jgi:hypothetical protein